MHFSCELRRGFAVKTKKRLNFDVFYRFHPSLGWRIIGFLEDVKNARFTRNLAFLVVFIFLVLFLVDSFFVCALCLCLVAGRGLEQQSALVAKDFLFEGNRALNGFAPFCDLGTGELNS